MALPTGMREALRRVAGRRLVAGGMTRVAIRRNLSENAARVAAGAVQPGMPTGEWEEVMAYKRPLPAERRVATLTIGDPSARGVVWGGCAGQIGPMAQITLDRGPAELAGRCARMTVLTGRHRVCSEQRESRPGVFGDQSRRPPTDLLVAPFAIQPERGGMRVRVAPSAPPGDVELHRATIVVASQASRRSVCALERVTGFFFMIEREVLAEDVPSLRDVADAAVAGKLLVRYNGPPSAAPSLSRGIQPAIEQGRRRHRSEKYNEESLGTPVVQPHHAHHDNQRRRLVPVRKPHPSVQSHRMEPACDLRKRMNSKK